MTITATFSSNVVNFCEQLEEFWAYSQLLKGMSQRLSHCCVRELIPLMELPAVKQVSDDIELHLFISLMCYRVGRSNFTMLDIKPCKVLLKLAPMT